MDEIGPDEGLGESRGTVRVFVCSISSDPVDAVEPPNCTLLEDADVEERKAEELALDEIGTEEVGGNESVVKEVEVDEGVDKKRVDDVTELFHI